MKDIVIIGAGGFAKEVAWLIEDLNTNKQEWNLLGFIDDNVDLQGKEINGYKVIGNIESFQKMSSEIYSIVAVGNGEIRRKIVEKLKNKKFVTLIHPDVKISKFSEIGEGSIIFSGGIVSVNTKIGKHCIMNFNTIVGHDCMINDYVTMLTDVKISGNIKIESNVTVGTGASLIQNIKIGENSVIGMGSAVLQNVKANCTALGVPAKIYKNM